MLKSPWTRWAIVLGFALGGFFDGILLHQILQWHHLLSLVPGGDLRFQVLWDGYFHALMYVVAALGLWGLWRAHKGGRGESAPRLAGALLTGFGLWHVVDSVLSHWVLGIHRINLQSENVLLWDLIWFVVFGLAPMAAGLRLLRRGPPNGTGARGSPAAVLLLAGATVAAGAWAMRGPPDQPFTAVVFRPGAAPAQVMGALAATDGRLVWANEGLGVVVADVPADRRWRLYARGALLVSGAGAPAGCLDWSRTS